MASSSPEEQDFFSPQEVDTLNVVGLCPFFQSRDFVGNLYFEDPTISENAIDFVGSMRKLGYAYISDTTGHHYETEIEMKKKVELANLWKGFEERIRAGILEKLKQNPKKFTWGECKGAIIGQMRDVSQKMLDLGKTSTFCSILTVWVMKPSDSQPRPAVIVLELGDSAIYRYRFFGSQEGYKCEMLTDCGEASYASSIGGGVNGMALKICSLKSGDLFVLTTDGLDDHFEKGRKRQQKLEDKIENLNNFSRDVLQAVHECSAENEGKPLDNVFWALFNHSKKNALEKLKEGIIRDYELDDVGCVVVLGNFFDDGFMKELPVARQSPPEMGFFPSLFGKRETQRDEEGGETQGSGGRGLFSYFSDCFRRVF